MIIYSDKLYNILSPYLGIFEKKKTRGDEISKYSKLGNYDIILFGGHRIGRVVIDNFKDIKDKLLVVDYNPNIKVILTTVHMHEAFEFYKKGADYVLLPYMLSGDRVAGILSNVIGGKDSLQKLKKAHMKSLREHSTDTYQLTS